MPVPSEAAKQLLKAARYTKGLASEPGYVYHATNLDRAGDIAQEGLKLHRPQEFTDQTTWPDRSIDPRAYFANAENAWQFAPEEGHPVLLRAQESAHPFLTESTGDRYTNKVLPADLLEMLGEGGQWEKLKKYFSYAGGGRIVPRPPQLQATIDPDTGKIIYTPVDAGPQALPAPQFRNMGLPESVRRAAADVPATPTTFSGNRVSGGASPLEALGAMDIPFRAAGDVAYEGSGSPALGALTQAGLAIASPSSLGKGARFLGKAAAEKLPGALEGLAGKMGTQMYAVKPRGGQWIEPDLSELMPKHLGVVRPENVELNKYADKNLRKWIKTSMGTEETDALAKELGIDYPQSVKESQKAQNPFDEIRIWPASKYQAHEVNYPRRDEWMSKLDPNTSIHSIADDRGGGLPESITSMFDYLRTVAPEKLKNIAVPDALRQSKAWHDTIAKKQTEDALKAGSLTTHREYPTGFKWQEIVAPENLPEGYAVQPLASGKGHEVLTPEGRAIAVGKTPEAAMKDASKTLLAQGLDAEGKMMGHCVGSYCDQVSGGGTRIFSLRDPAGKPHVTVEVAPDTRRRSQAFNDWELEAPNTEQEAMRQTWKDTGGIASNGSFKKWVMTQIPPEPPTIQQIKGKQNAAPTETYLPYVQDFVKNSPLGSPWGDVKDLKNADLYRPGTRGHYLTGDEMGQVERAVSNGRYGSTPEEYDRAIEDILGEQKKAAGGAVTWAEKFAQGKRHSENVEDKRRDAKPDSKGPAAREPLPADTGLDTLAQSARLNLAEGGAVELEPDAEAYLQTLLEAA